MAIHGIYTESSLATSEVFKGVNQATHAQEKAINLIKTGKHLTNEDIEAAYISVKQITDTLTRAALKAFDEERIVMVYNSVPKLNVTEALPFATFKTPKGHITYIFASKYVKLGRDNVLRIEPSVLRDLLTGALIANSLKQNYELLASNQYLQKVCMDVYTKLVTRIINKDYSIAADRPTFDVIQYFINKFFLTKIFCASDTPENIDILSSAHYKFIDEIQADEAKNKYTEVDPQTISDLLKLLTTTSTRMKNLNLGTFMSSWINTYYGPVTFAIDNIEYLIFMMLALLSGNNYITNIGASNIVKDAKNIKSFRAELLKLTQTE